MHMRAADLTATEALSVAWAFGLHMPRTRAELDAALDAWPHHYLHAMPERRCSACGQPMPSGRQYRQEATSSKGCGTCGAPAVRHAQAETRADDEDSGAHPAPGTAEGSTRYG
jgi:hypothetical protein